MAGTGRSPRDTGGQGSLEVHRGPLAKSQKIKDRLPLRPCWASEPGVALDRLLNFLSLCFSIRKPPSGNFGAQARRCPQQDGQSQPRSLSCWPPTWLRTAPSLCITICTACKCA